MTYGHYIVLENLLVRWANLEKKYIVSLGRTKPLNQCMSSLMPFPYVAFVEFMFSVLIQKEQINETSFTFLVQQLKNPLQALPSCTEIKTKT